LKSSLKIFVSVLLLFVTTKQYSQNNSHIVVELNSEKKILVVQQKIVFQNQSQDTLNSIVLNDWNNAYSSKNSPLAKRFSDEFYRGFHLAKEEERGNTTILSLTNTEQSELAWNRTDENPDFIIVDLKDKLAPNQQINLHLSYIIKIPSDKFTKYGCSDNGNMVLKNWFLAPARYENHAFVTYNNNNLDDCANSISDYTIELKTPSSPNNLEVTTDLNFIKKTQTENHTIYELIGKNRTDFSLFIESKSSFSSFKNSKLEVITNFSSQKIDGIHKAIIINQIIDFTSDFIGQYPYEKITVSQVDYDRNPFYGLNQLPSFLSPFPDEFIFEIQFLKTYLNNYLKNSLKLDPRKDNWIYDGIQVYAMMKYIDEYYPESKMMGRISKIRLLKSFNLTQLGFNEQYGYFYMLMARKNLDQPLNNSKNTLIKFNEQIANKYKAGVSFKYLSDYLGDTIINKSIQDFYTQNIEKQTSRTDFETILKSKTTKDINWFFNTIIDTRDLIDYKIKQVSKTKDGLQFSLKNKTNNPVPIPAYGFKKGEIIFKEWLYPKNMDSIYSFKIKDVDKIVLNFKNEVPEYNLRNNWKKIGGFFPNNRPIKFVFMKDFEDPYYNQILYVPTLGYNLYDGLTLGMRLHNRTILDKPFVFDINPAYSTTSKSLSGSAVFIINQNYRNRNLFNIRYSASGSYFHYTPDATYLKLNPTIVFNIREDNIRINHKQLFLVRQVLVDREKSVFVVDNTNENYSVFNVKYYNSKTEITKHFNFVTDFQIAGDFGKIATEFGFRKLLNNNRQFNLRAYAGSFLYNKTNSDFFSFALDRPTDYLFDYNFFGRSESTGLFSQQYIIAEGGFKSKLKNPYANQWISTLNTSFSIWNWVEAYGDIGIIKNKYQKEKWVYDSGIRLNLVTDYFELYFPVYSNNGWEISQEKYTQKIRFIITFSPRTLTTLFTRKWF
jgi:hypothetical protein